VNHIAILVAQLEDHRLQPAITESNAFRSACMVASTNAERHHMHLMKLTFARHCFGLRAAVAFLLSLCLG
jgi:hypothetical protein